MIAAFMSLTGGTLPDRYAAGQVWEYRNRTGDEGSLLKIQRVEEAPPGLTRGKIYHISIVGFHLRTANVSPVLPHAPVSQQTLDQSVTKLAAVDRPFPSADPGIAEWRRANGGVYTISVAEIIETLDHTLVEQGQ